MTRPKELAYIENGVVTDSNGEPLPAPPGSGVSRFADLTDRATADIPGTNAPLANALAAKQDVLVSNVHVKTVNGQSILGPGNIAVGGGSSYPEALNFSALPGAPGEGTTYVVLTSQGIAFVNRRPAGLYRFTSGQWVFLGELPDGYFTDNVLRFYDDADPTKQVIFQLSGITTGNTRTLTVPDASGTLALTSQIPTNFVPIGNFVGVGSDRVIAAGDNNAVFDTGATSRLFTIPQDLAANFIGFSVDGPCTFAGSGTATVTEDRPTGKGYNFCQVIRTATNRYRVFGGRT